MCPPDRVACTLQGYHWYKFRQVDIAHLAACCTDKRLFIGDAFPDAAEAR